MASQNGKQGATRRLLEVINPALLNLALTEPPQMIDNATRDILKNKYSLGEHYTDRRILSFYGGPVFELFISESIRKKEMLGIDYNAFSQLHAAMINQHAFITALDDSDSDVCVRLNKISAEYAAKNKFQPAVAGVISPADQLKNAAMDPYHYTQNLTGQQVYTPPPVFNCSISMTAILGALFVQLGFKGINEIYELFNNLVDTNAVARVALNDARDLTTADVVRQASGATTLSYAASKRKRTTPTPTPPAVLVPPPKSPFVAPVVLPPVAQTATAVAVTTTPTLVQHKLPSLSMPLENDLDKFLMSYQKQSGYTLDVVLDPTNGIASLLAIEMKNDNTIKKYQIKQYKNIREIDADTFKGMLIDSGVWVK